MPQMPPPAAILQDGALVFSPWRPRPVLTGGDVVSRFNGETLLAGRSNPVGQGLHAVDKAVVYHSRMLSRELHEKFGGDIRRMEKKFGFNPVFVQWRQEQTTSSGTGGIEQMRHDHRRRAATVCVPP